MLFHKFQVIKHLKYNTITVPPLYEESFKKAILTFQHQRVYDPIKEDIVHLSDPSENIGEDLDFLGPYPWNLIYYYYSYAAKYVHKHSSIRKSLSIIP